ncbi:Mobile element protein [Euzebya pacifica]|uniref:Mobile element protein n=1 Tax=Euzebya pacifica TaxID=1608957 RepID=A0A346XX13_9ACTN|nr:Mobile element protein [Euzebya pacifica]
MTRWVNGVFNSSGGRSRFGSGSATGSPPPPTRTPTPTGTRAHDAERAEVVGLLTSQRFCDLPPAQVWARLLDEDSDYLCFESAALARDLLDPCTKAEHIGRDQLTIHADRGTSMTSRTVAQLLADLGITRSHSRPHVSNDNPYSEAQFKTSSTPPPSPAASPTSATPAGSPTPRTHHPDNQLDQPTHTRNQRRPVSPGLTRSGSAMSVTPC